MEKAKSQKTISIICGIVGIIVSLAALMVGLRSIGASGWNQLGVLLIAPAIIALVIIVLDFLITIDKIKKGLTYSYISSAIKIGIILLLIPSTISEYKNEIGTGISNFDLVLNLILILIMILIPSIFNIIKFKHQKKSK